MARRLRVYGATLPYRAWPGRVNRRPVRSTNSSHWMRQRRPCWGRRYRLGRSVLETPSYGKSAEAGAAAGVAGLVAVPKVQVPADGLNSS